MAKVITFSRYFPKGHPQAGRPTHFPEKTVRSLGYDPGSDEYWALLHELNPDKRFLVDRFILSLNSFLPQGSEKLHTIRAGHHWKQGEKASPRVWSGKPYNSPQIIIAQDVELVQVGGFLIHPDADDYDKYSWVDISGKYWHKTDEDINKSIIPTVAKNDGLSTEDFLAWFKYPKPFEGQILCWKEVDYV